MPTDVITVHDLTVHRGGSPVLRGFSATFPRASVTVVTGPNGSGKSTLLEALAGVAPIASGSISGVSGRSVALVAQRVDRSALPLDVRQLVAMGRWGRRRPWQRLSREDRTVVEASLVRMDLADLRRRPVETLSGGQRQRAFLAAGLAQQAEVLLVDEPTAGVDARSLDLVRAALDEEAGRGATVLHAAHDPAVVHDARYRLDLQP